MEASLLRRKRDGGTRSSTSQKSSGPEGIILSGPPNHGERRVLTSSETENQRGKEVRFDGDHRQRNSNGDKMKSVGAERGNTSLEQRRVEKRRFLSSTERGNQRAKRVLVDEGHRQRNSNGDKIKSVGAECSNTSLERRRVEKALNCYQELVDKLTQESCSEGRSVKGLALHLEVAKTLKFQYKCVNTNKLIGEVPGIQIGDEFNWRAQLTVVGLHHQPYSGIDYMKVEGKTLATSIVFSGKYDNVAGSLDTLVYCGEGQNPTVSFQALRPKDQKLEGGNLALKNSIDSRSPVRVIRKLRKVSSGDCKFVYDGLYTVHDYKQGRGQFGKLIFKFVLKREPGQPQLDWGKYHPW